MTFRAVARPLALVGALAGLAIPAQSAHAQEGFAGPIFGLTASPDGGLLVADAGQGIVATDGDTHELVVPLPGAADVTTTAGGDLWAITGIGDAPSAQQLFRVSDGGVTPFADLFAYEERKNPHPALVDSNPFDVADLGRGEAVVADAGGNDLLRVNKHGKVKLVAVLPDELVSTSNVKDLVGCPDAPPDAAGLCELPPMIPGEPVATSVAIGPDGAFYVGELKGFPAPTGESRVWRIAPNARNAKCGQSPLCTVALDGMTSVVDLAFGPDGRLYVAELEERSWFAVESGIPGLGGTINACDVATGSCEVVADGIPMLTAIAFDSGGQLWATQNALVPPLADVVPITL